MSLRGRATPTKLLSAPWTLRLASLLGLIAIWEPLGRQNPVFVSYPSAIATAFVELTFVESTLIEAFAVTFKGLAVGYIIAAVLGTAIGFAMGRIRLVEIILEPYVNALYATPRIALVPLLVLWVGIGFGMRVTIVVLSAIFPIIVNVYLGAKSVDGNYLETGRAFDASGSQLLRTVVVPASLPYLFAGLRIGVARGLIGVIVAEMTAAVTGTGRLIILSGRFLETDRLLVPVIILGLISIALAEVIYFVQRRVAPWARGTA